jgi:hypothetical protein
MVDIWASAGAGFDVRTLNPALRSGHC